MNLLIFRLLATAAVLWLVSSASGASAPKLINVQFGIDASPLKEGPAAYGQSATDYWNRYSRDLPNGGYKSLGALNGLKWSDGSDSTAGLTIANAPGAWGNGNPDPMFGVYLYASNSDPITITVTNLPAGRYTVYAYAHGGPPDNQNAAIEILGGTTSYGVAKTTTQPGWNNTNWVEGRQYVRFTGVTVSAGESLTIMSRADGITQALINGLQLVEEPAAPVTPLALLNINFGVDETPVRTGPAATGLSENDQWNLYSRDDGNGGYKQSGGLVNLKWADGSLSSAGMIIENAPGAWGNGNADPMFGVYLYAFNSDPVTITVTNLPSGRYTIYAYAHGGPPDEQNAAIEVLSGGTSYGIAKTTTKTGWNNTNWSEGRQYVRFTGVFLHPGSPLTIISRPDGISQAMINGLQIVAEPAEPLALLNVNFGVDATPVKTGFAATGLTDTDVWNLYSRDDGNGGYKSSGGLANLRWANGTTSPAGLTINNAPGAWGNGNPDSMFGVYLYPLGGGPDVTVTLTNLPAGTYQFYCYGHGGPPDIQNAKFELISEGISYGEKLTAKQPGWNNTNWAEGQQYVVYANVAVSGTLPVTIIAKPDGINIGMINGLQILRTGPYTPPLATLTLTPSGGLFTNEVQVAMSANVAGLEIRYTLDGSNPTAASLLYSSPVRLTTATTVRAAVFSGGTAVSTVVTTTYSRVYALNDGITAEWRQRYWGDGYLTDPRVAAEADPDGDGATNLQEFTVGSDPTDPLSGFRTQLRMVPQLQWHSVPGLKYRVLRKQAITDPNWTLVKEITATGPLTRFTHEDSDDTHAIYVVEVVR